MSGSDDMNFDPEAEADHEKAMAEVSEETIRDIAVTWFHDRRQDTDNVVEDLCAHLRRHLQSEPEQPPKHDQQAVEEYAKQAAREIWNADEAGTFDLIVNGVRKAIQYGRSLGEPVDVEALTKAVCDELPGAPDWRREVRNIVRRHCEGRTKAQPGVTEDQVEAAADAVRSIFESVSRAGGSLFYAKGSLRDGEVKRAIREALAVQPEPKEEPGVTESEYPWVVAEYDDRPGFRGIGFSGSDDGPPGPPSGVAGGVDNLVSALDDAFGGDLVAMLQAQLKEWRQR